MEWNWIDATTGFPQPGELALGWVCNIDTKGRPAGPCFPRMVYWSAARNWRDAADHHRLHVSHWCCVTGPTGTQGTLERLPDPATEAARRPAA